MTLLSSHPKGNQYFQMHRKLIHGVFAAKCMQFILLPFHPLYKSNVRITLGNMAVSIRSCFLLSNVVNNLISK